MSLAIGRFLLAISLCGLFACAAFAAPGMKVTPEDGDWAKTSLELFNTPEAEQVVRYGDIDNLGFGWIGEYTPFSGEESPTHTWPFSPQPTDPAGTDRIMVPSSYKGIGPQGSDGYANTTKRPENLPQPLTFTFTKPKNPLSAVVLQMMVDDFQAPVWGAKYEVTINGKRIPVIEEVMNTLQQTGPRGKLISISLPDDVVATLATNRFAMTIDDTTTGAGDGYAIDFVRLLINPTRAKYTGTVRGKVTAKATGAGLAGVMVSAGTARNALTDAAGNFTLTNVPVGMTVITASKDGYKAAGVTRELQQGKTVEVTLALDAAPVTTTTPPKTGGTLDLWGSMDTQAVIRRMLFDGKAFYAVGNSGTIFSSPDGKTWTPVPLGGEDNLTGLCSNGKSAVLTGDWGALFATADWKTFARAPRVSPRHSANAGWTGKQFVAVGHHGQVLVSPTGETWRQVTTPTTANLRDVVTHGGQLVVVGADGMILTSPDGETWQQRPSGTTAMLEMAASNGQRIVVIGDKGTIITSTDGRQWTPVQSSTDASLVRLCYTGDRFVAVGSAGTALESLDGLTWWKLTTNTTDAFYGCAAGNGVVLAVTPQGKVYGYRPGGTPTVTPPAAPPNVKVETKIIKDPLTNIYTITALVKDADPTAFQYCFDMAERTNGTALSWGNIGGYSDNNYARFRVPKLGVTYAFRIQLLPKGGTVPAVVMTSLTVGETPATPTPATPPANDPWQRRDTYTSTPMTYRATFHDGQRFFVAGNGGYIVDSVDGKTWNRAAVPATHITGIAWNGKTAVLVGDRGTIILSPDWKAWTVVKSGVGSHINGVVWTGKAFVAVQHGGGVLLSPDGTTWRRVQTPTTNHLLHVDWNGRFLTAVGIGGVILTSPDGETWQAVPSGVTTDLHGVGHNGGRLVAAGGGVILTSTDGRTWKATTVEAPEGLGGVCAAGDGFIVTGYGGHAFYSADGQTWTRLITGIKANLRAPIAANGIGIAGSDQGYVYLFTAPNATGGAPPTDTPAKSGVELETAREGNTVTIIARVTPPGAYEYHFQASTLEKPGALNWTTLHPYSTDNTAKMTVANGQTYLLVVWTRPVGSVLPCEAGTFKVFKATGLEAAPVPDPLANRPWFEHRTKAFRFHVAEGWNADYDDERANDYVINDKQTLAILIVKKVDDLGGKDGAAMLAELEKKWTERLKQSHVEHLTLDGEPAILISAFNEEKKKGMLWQLYVAHAGKLYDIGIVDPNATEFIRDAPAETVTMLKTWDFTP